MRAKILAVLMVTAALAVGWSVVERMTEPASETELTQAKPPARAIEDRRGGPDSAPAIAPGQLVRSAPVAATRVNLRDIPPGVFDPDNQYDRGRRSGGRIEAPVPDETVAAMRRASRNLPRSANLQIEGTAATFAPQAIASGSFDSIDYTECCGGGGNVPPDPELAVGPNHVVAVVNVAFEIYDKGGASLSGPTTFSSFMAADRNCTGVFDPNALYDESADRYILGIDADGAYYCVAVSQTGDPTGSWNIYSFSTAGRRDFFDYPHAGVGRDALYMGANIFSTGGGPFGGGFKEARVWAFDKAAMYAGQPAAAVSIGLATSEDTPQPLHLHGWAQGTWPTSGPHYLFTETDYNGATYSVFSWNDPFGANDFGLVGTVDLEAATQVAAGMPVDVPQLGGQTIQGNDFRPQDFEYRNGSAWSTMAIACNPGGGTVNCVRWAQIDPATATVEDAGVYASNGEYRIFPDLAVDHCDGMMVGYTKSSTSMYPGIFATGREATDPAGTLQSESEVQSGEIAYTSFESSAPRRWGDYTEMTIDPDGTTFWYLGEYAKDTGTTNGRWGTYISSFTFGCDPGGGTGGDNPPSVNLTAPADGATVSGSQVPITANASDDTGVARVEFFVDGGRIGVDTTAPYEASWDSTAVGDGSHTISATATDSIGQTGGDSITVTVDNVPDPPATTFHVGDLDGSATPGRGNRWDVTVTVTVHDANENPVANATVSGSWGASANGSGSCTTDGNGQCSVSKNNVRGATASFSVTDVSASGFTYEPSDNHDPDGDSDGTTIVVPQP